ncbi:MAG TPA: rhodanese-like domain-containing protein [Pyrinomonadaceae bacterium]|jgi:3-mercaptopyruvate sulfurtransferase SseA
MRLLISLALSFVLALALLAACSPRDGSSSVAAQNPQAANAAAQPTSPQPGAPAQEGDGVRRVTQQELRASMEKGEVAVFDVRDKTSYEAGHIKGAKLVPWDQVEHRLGEFPKDKLVVTYCA